MSRTRYRPRHNYRAAHRREIAALRLSYRELELDEDVLAAELEYAGDEYAPRIRPTGYRRWWKVISMLDDKHFDSNQSNVRWPQSAIRQMYSPAQIARLSRRNLATIERDHAVRTLRGIISTTHRYWKFDIRQIGWVQPQRICPTAHDF